MLYEILLLKINILTIRICELIHSFGKLSGRNNSLLLIIKRIHNIYYCRFIKIQILNLDSLNG